MEDGNDTGLGEAGNDYIYAGNGNDSLFGGAGNDILLGEAGNDFLFGGGSAFNGGASVMITCSAAQEGTCSLFRTFQA